MSRGSPISRSQIELNGIDIDLSSVIVKDFILVWFDSYTGTTHEHFDTSHLVWVDSAFLFILILIWLHIPRIIIQNFYVNCLIINIVDWHAQELIFIVIIILLLSGHTVEFVRGCFGISQMLFS